MGDKDEEIQDLYVAAYSDADAAKEDWEALKRLAADEAVKVHALALVNRDDDGKIHVKDTRNETGIGAAVGAVGGALVGLIFPPSLIASAAVGAGLGAGSGKIVDRVTKRKVRSEVEWNVPAGGSGIAVIFDEEGAAQVEQTLVKAAHISRRHLHDSDADEPVDERYE